MEEKRRLERYDLRLPAKIDALASDEETEVLNLMTSDVCAGGAFFHTKEPLPEGTEVKIDLVLPLDRLEVKDDFTHAFINVTGTVVRSGPKGMAICFKNDYRIRPHRAGESTLH
jgi:hypothetical protein